MRKTLRSAVLAATLIGLMVVSGLPELRVFAQAALNQTTLAAALPAPTQGNQQQRVTLASGATIAAGQGMYIDREYMTVSAATGTSTVWTVARGQRGTSAQAHASGAAVLTGAPNYFADNDVVGPCVSTAITALPYINVGAGNIYTCPAVTTLTGSTAGTWGRIKLGGYGVVSDNPTGWTYTTLGAITIQPGVTFIGSAGALAMTLADPPLYANGMTMIIQASTAQAHTVTYTAGFYGTTTSSDVATFGGAIGDNLVIYAIGGVWRVMSLKGVTIA